MSAESHEPGDRVLETLWPPERTPRPGPRPRLSLDQVVDAAIAVADADGLPAVSMRSVAESLGTTKMALYRYVPGKAELLALMLESALGSPDLAGGRRRRDGRSGRVPRWRVELTAWTRALHERQRARPWTVELSQRPHPPGPHELEWYESALSAMGDLELPGAEKLDVLVLLSGHAGSLARQTAGTTRAETDLAAAVTAILAERTERYPATAAAFADPTGAGRNDALAFGIDRILDGVQARVNA